jgi:hypothetical protein
VTRERFGYDVTPYLPAIYDEGGNWEDGNWGATGNYMGEPVPEFAFDKNSSQVLNDWRELLTELYEANHVQPIAEWAAKNGVTLRYQTSYGKDMEDLEYSYEVIDDPEKLPETTYTAATTDTLAGLLYTVKSGLYKYGENDAVPEYKETGDVNAINSIMDIKAGDDSIKIKVMTQGADDMFTNRVIYDNKAAAELYGCEYTEGSKIDRFENDRDSLSLTYKKTYDKVNDNTTADAALRYDTDNFFTPCSYLAELNDKADIIHIRTNGANATKVANTLLCYIKTKGNTSFF